MSDWHQSRSRSAQRRARKSLRKEVFVALENDLKATWAELGRCFEDSSFNLVFNLHVDRRRNSLCASYTDEDRHLVFALDVSVDLAQGEA